MWSTSMDAIGDHAAHSALPPCTPGALQSRLESIVEVFSARAGGSNAQADTPMTVELVGAGTAFPVSDTPLSKPMESVDPMGDEPHGVAPAEN